MGMYKVDSRLHAGMRKPVHACALACSLILPATRKQADICQAWNQLADECIAHLPVEQAPHRPTRPTAWNPMSSTAGHRECRH